MLIVFRDTITYLTVLFSSEIAFFIFCLHLTGKNVGIQEFRQFCKLQSFPGFVFCCGLFKGDLTPIAPFTNMV